jgi:hypothetical protein
MTLPSRLGIRGIAGPLRDSTDHEDPGGRPVQAANPSR